MTQVTRLTLNEDGSLSHRRIHLREISGDLDSPLETVGQDLRTARLERGDDLLSISRSLKIRTEHLEALEENRIESLPGRTYAVGFVRSYANYLGLDSNAFVARFKAEIAGRNDVAATHVDVIDEDERKKLPQGWWMIAGVVVILIFYGFYQLVAASNRDVRVSEPPPLETPLPIVAKPTPPVAVRQVQVAAAAANPVPAVAAPAAAADTPSSSSPAPADTKPIPQGTVYGQHNLNYRVVLRALQPTRLWVVDGRGKLFLGHPLNAGDSYRVPNIVGLKLTASDAGAIEVAMDGQVLGRAGKTGEVVRSLSLDPQAIAGRFGR
jgi:cytoskeleton protein RodZ